MNDPKPRKTALEREAAVWLARCDRGLSPEEQDRLQQWLQADPRREQALTRLRAVWKQMDGLGVLRPTGMPADPDLLRSIRRPE